VHGRVLQGPSTRCYFTAGGSRIRWCWRSSTDDGEARSRHPGVEGGPEGRQVGPTGDEDVSEEADELPGEDVAARSAILRQAATTDPASLSLDLLSEGERAQFIEDVAAGRVQPDGVQSWAPWWDATEATHVAAARLQDFRKYRSCSAGLLLACMQRKANPPVKQRAVKAFRRPYLKVSPRSHLNHYSLISSC